MYLTDFQSIRPPFESDQKDTLDWLIFAHTEAEKKKGVQGSCLKEFSEKFKKELYHVGCKPGSIHKRGHVLKDFLHQNWKEMKVYSLEDEASGKNLSERSKIFSGVVNELFESYYPIGIKPPDDLIHVSCTGYVSPSGAQRIVSLRDWGQTTTVTHAYHMGCYGSIPALRMASGFLKNQKKQTDIVHTELCSLHLNPASHEKDQLVSQSLFADGFIKYSLLKKTKKPCFKVLALYEEIIPDTIHAMTWDVGHLGFKMTLSKEIPIYLFNVLKLYLQRLCEKANLSLEELLNEAYFAIHPGGPKILSYIQKLLSLKEEKLLQSREILGKYGNMSSATLPHIWESMLKNQKILKGAKVVSLAFGPGLSIAGNILEKRCGN